METYIGTKLIKAMPMNRLEYNEYQGWDLPIGENGGDEGYLVEYLDGGKPNHPDHEGYISWSPKGVFENAYRKTDGLSFGLAIEAAKLGKKIARKGWNGKNMFIFMIAAHAWGFETDVSGVDEIETLPFLCMKTADDKLVPWFASQADMASDDWCIVV